MYIWTLFTDPSAETQVTHTLITIAHQHNIKIITPNSKRSGTEKDPVVFFRERPGIVKIELYLPTPDHDFWDQPLFSFLIDLLTITEAKHLVFETYDIDTGKEKIAQWRDSLDKFIFPPNGVVLRDPQATWFGAFMDKEQRDLLRYRKNNCELFMIRYFNGTSNTRSYLEVNEPYLELEQLWWCNLSWMDVKFDEYHASYFPPGIHNWHFNIEQCNLLEVGRKLVQESDLTMVPLPVNVLDSVFPFLNPQHQSRLSRLEPRDKNLLIDELKQAVLKSPSELTDDERISIEAKLFNTIRLVGRSWDFECLIQKIQVLPSSKNSEDVWVYLSEAIDKQEELKLMAKLFKILNASMGTGPDAGFVSSDIKPYPKITLAIDGPWKNNVLGIPVLIE